MSVEECQKITSSCKDRTTDPLTRFKEVDSTLQESSAAVPGDNDALLYYLKIKMLNRF